MCLSLLFEESPENDVHEISWKAEDDDDDDEDDEEGAEEEEAEEEELRYQF